MLFTNKTFPILLVCAVVLSSVYGYVSADVRTVNQDDIIQNKVISSDTSKQTAPKFPIKKFTQNTYEELNTQYPMDAPKPDNVKSVVEYDTKSGNYVLRTFVGETETGVS